MLCQKKEKKSCMTIGTETYIEQESIKESIQNCTDQHNGIGVKRNALIPIPPQHAILLLIESCVVSGNPGQLNLLYFLFCVMHFFLLPYETLISSTSRLQHYFPLVPQYFH